MTDYGKKAIQNITIVFLISLISAFLAYAFRFILARKLSVAEYGLFFSILAFINVLALFKDWGLGYALLKYIPELQVKKKIQEIKSLIISSALIQLISSAIITMLIIYFAEYLAQNFFQTTNFKLIYIFAIIFFLSFPQNIISVCLMAFQRTILYAIQDVSRNLILLILTIIFFSLNLQIASPASAYLIMYLLIFLIFFTIFIKKVFKEFLTSKTILNKNNFSALFFFGLPAMITILGNNLLQYTDTLMLTYFTNLESVGLYQVAVPLTNLILYFAYAASCVATPMIAELVALNKKTELQNGITLLHKYILLIIIPLSLTLFIFPELFIKLFFGDKFIAAILPLQILSIGIIFYTLAYTNLNIIFGLGKPKYNTFIMIITATTNIILNLILIHRYQIVGAAIATTISYFLMLIISNYKINKLVDVKESWTTLLKVIISTIMFFATALIIKKLLELAPIAEFLIALIISAIIYLILNILLKTVKVQELLWILNQLGLRRTK